MLLLGGKGDGDREHAMFGMQLRPLELSLQASASLCHSYIMLQYLVTSELGIPIFSMFPAPGLGNHEARGLPIFETPCQTTSLSN